MSNLPKSSLAIKVGLGLASLATVLLELVMTRLFSLSAGYHFSFMIVSLAMFGLTAGALVSSISRTERDKPVEALLQRNAIYFAIAVPLATFTHNYLTSQMSSLNPLAWVASSFVLFSIPFFFAGRCLCLCLTRYEDSGKLYAADLIGAAVACPILVLCLTFADPQICLAVAGLAAVFAAGLFSQLKDASKVVLTAFAFATISNIINPFLASEAVIGVGSPVESIVWSPVGRVTVTSVHAPATTWAKVDVPQKPIRQKGLYIDFGAFTVMTEGNTTDEQLEPIKRDVTAVGNYLRPHNSLFVIGVGGGRDVLTGLLYGQKKIDGVELNPAIVDMVKHRYAEFNGFLAKKPGVTIVNDEARNWLARSKEKYGLIQCSLVDTWAASTSGAYMLTENILYTKEAFDIYLKHLEPKGVLCFLRWGDRNQPAELTRMLNIAKSALLDAGVSDPSRHMMLLSCEYRESGHKIGVMLASLEPFSDDDLDKIQKLSDERGYESLYIPARAAVEPFSTVITTAGVDGDIPTDDCPFFFSPAKQGKSISNPGEPAQGAGLALLQFTMIVAGVLVATVILIPAWRTVGSNLGAGTRELAMSGLFFSCLGVAYMLVEVGLMERLTLMLGNPTYSLSVVLFSMLLASGIGSYTAEVLSQKYQTRRLLVVAAVAAAFLGTAANVASRYGLSYWEAYPLLLRALIAVVLVAVPAFFMGWPFPLGLKHFGRGSSVKGAWFWALNGSLSVLGSILAAIISIMYGISASLYGGAACYLIALLSLL